MDYKRINTLTGWAVFAIALVSYLMTMAPTASYWDCGEFIACSNELEVPHPPGAPFYLLVGRIFAMFSFGDATNVAWMLNLMSALCSAFTVLFTFWITTHLGEKLIGPRGTKPTQIQTAVIMLAGIVGGLANAYADSFWFNAVEAEVYAMSSFFTAIVVWLMFKWEERADEPGHLRYLILIAYLMGLSIGVHLLNLLTIPALAFIYYFRKYEFSWKGFFITGGISVAILGIIQTGIILYTFDLAWAFERFFGSVQALDGSESGLGLPLGTGVGVFFVLLFGAIGYLIYWSHKQGRVNLNTALISGLVIYIGFASYLMIPIRSQVNPPIDENNPENTQTFLSYMKREQYGSRPLLKGPLYNAQPIGLEEVGKEYALDKETGQYIEIGTKRQYEYAARDMKTFPRMYDNARPLSWDPRQGPFTYANFVQRTGQPGTPYDDRPTPGEDLKYFFQYQIGHMYLRYFMWNFAGKEGDAQNAGWESGLNFGNTSKMPEFIKDHPAKNHFYLLPVLLGILGLSWQASKRGQDAVVVGLLFFFTGLAIIIYLNQYPNQPRERDYSFAGSFQTFAIWIGLGVIALYQLLEKYLKNAAVIVAGVIGLLVPTIMAAQGWDDHSRHTRYVAPDSAYNLLNSLAPNAVLFTNGDNDTFPLWYLQEVEGVRTDVRVLCLSYVNTDWYIDQMNMKMNDSEPLPLSLSPDQYVGQANQSRSYGNQKQDNRTLSVDAQALLRQGIIDEEDLPFVEAPMRWTFPTRGREGSKYLELKDVLIVNLLENVSQNNWERPVYFANTVSPSSYLGLDRYLRQEGLAYRILPVKKPAISDNYDSFSGNVDQERMHDALVNKFRYRNLDIEGVYYDENIMRMLANYYNTFYRLGTSYLRDVETLQADNRQIQQQLNAEEDRRNPVNRDSLEAALTRNQETIRTKLDLARELTLHGEASFPAGVITPDPYMMTRSALVVQRIAEKYLGRDDEKAAEMQALADKYFDIIETRVVGTLGYYGSVEVPFYSQREYAIALSLLLNVYSNLSQQTSNQELKQKLQERFQNLQQERQNLNPRILNMQ